MRGGVSLYLNGTDNVVPMAVFLKGAGLFWNLLRDVERATSTDGPKLNWYVSDLKPGSALVTLDAPLIASVPYAPADIAWEVMAGLHLLEEGTGIPEQFSRVALAHARELSLLASAKGAHVEFRTGDRSVSLSAHTAKRVDEILASPITEIGAIDGTVRLIGSQNFLHCNVYDRVTGAAVSCPLTEDQLPKLLNAFNRRVQISGLIDYAPDGTPKKIREIHGFVVVSGDSELPTQNSPLMESLNLLGEWSIEEWEARHYGE